MSAVLRLVRFFGGTAILTKQTVSEMVRPPIYFSLIIQQMHEIGVRSFPLVGIVAISTGMVMSLQFGVGLEKFGGKLYVPKVVSLSIVRELGPVFTCLMLAARVGAGITSEIGSMVVTQQIDAIRALGTSPIKKIVLPRFVACLITIPLLSAIAIVIGILGGMIVGVLDLGLDPLFYLQKIYETINLADYFSGMAKTVFFGFFITVVSCYFGLTVKGGTQGVGQATTRSVVVSSVFVVVGDYFLTKLFLIFEGML